MKQNKIYIFNWKILYLTIPIVCRKNLSHSNYIDCKSITINGNEKVFLVRCLDYCQCFEIH
jgi:hypothetical protein